MISPLDERKRRRGCDWLVPYAPEPFTQQEEFVVLVLTCIFIALLPLFFVIFVIVVVVIVIILIIVVMIAIYYHFYYYFYYCLLFIHGNHQLLYCYLSFFRKLIAGLSQATFIIFVWTKNSHIRGTLPLPASDWGCGGLWFESWSWRIVYFKYFNNGHYESI